MSWNPDENQMAALLEYIDARIDEKVAEAMADIEDQDLVLDTVIKRQALMNSVRLPDFGDFAPNEPQPE